MLEIGIWKEKNYLRVPWWNLNEAVSIFPNLGKHHGRMEPVKDAQRQSKTLHDGPWQESVETHLLQSQISQ